MSNQNQKPSEEWAETHYQFAILTETDIPVEGTLANFKGMGGAWELAYNLTNEFMEWWEKNGSDELTWFDELEAFYSINRLIQGEEGDKFPRKCTFTNSGMVEGWCFEDGTYASTQELADKYAKELGYANFYDAHQDNSENYWTSWEHCDDEFIVVNGRLTEIEED